jgi:hypothetical protein
MVDDSGAIVQDLEHAAFFLGKGGIQFACQVAPEEGRDGDLGYDLFIEKTDQTITIADIAGTYLVRFLQTGPGVVPYTCTEGAYVIEPVDDVNGVASVSAYYSDGRQDVRSIDCSVGPGNAFHLDDDGVADGIISPDKKLIFLPEYRYSDPTAREDSDWLGGIFLVRVPVGLRPVYRFWSPDNSRHFYTISESEKEHVLATYPPSTWTYEAVAYYAYADNSELSLAPVYRLWSPTLGSHFYTIDPDERDLMLAEHPDVWTYEGPVFYAYPEGSQPADTSAVYRFWSETFGTYFYTINESEKDFIIANYPHAWEYETIAWYAYEP